MPKKNLPSNIPIRRSSRINLNMTAPVQMSEQQLQQLLAAVVAAGGTATVENRSGSFSNCTARFKGERDFEEVESFISKISIYKTIEKISDEEALRGLPLLLCDNASVWWQGVKGEVTKWEDAISSIRAAFSPAKLPCQIYLEIFSEKQDDTTPTDVFICKKRSLLAQLPKQRHDETTQIDFVFSLLNLRIREKVNRSDVPTFQELLKKARDIEALASKSNTNVENTEKESKSETGTKKKIRCNYCNFRGHLKENCRKYLAKRSAENKQNNS